MIKKPEFVLRPMQEEDLMQVVAIEQSAHAFPWAESTFRECFRVEYHCWVLSEKQEILGYLIGSIKAKECHIFNIAVRTDRQRQGYGRRLLAAVLYEAKAQGADTAFLEVRVSNEAAIALYRQAGFNEISLRKGYYQSIWGREDAITLGLQLKS